jgi:hypothetical protein
MKQEGQAFFIGQPADETPGVLSFEGGEKGSGAQDIALGPALDNQNAGGEGFEMRTAVAASFIIAGFFPPEMTAIGFERQTSILQPCGPNLHYLCHNGEEMTRTEMARVWRCIHSKARVCQNRGSEVMAVL